ARASDLDGALPSPAADVAETHYVVLDGRVRIEWSDPGGVHSAELTADGSVWVAPFVAHRWLGSGAVLRFGSGAHLGYLDWFELTNTFAAGDALGRGRHDRSGWGYQAGAR
ncbi:MAG: hypothetical protein ACRCYU_08345, partial [Nocardioides sp.]